jgi:hypothetical protein
MMMGMRFLPNLGFGGRAEHGPAVLAEAPATGAGMVEEEDSSLLKTVGWVSAALGAVALGLLVGREIRQRYKFSRRTPYDLYAHSGDELPDVDCGVGI